MTAEEYNYIIRVINENAGERMIFLGIRNELEEQGYDLRQIAYEDYLFLREKKMRTENREIRPAGQAAADIPPCIPENLRNAEGKTEEDTFSGKCTGPVLRTLFAAGAAIAVGLAFEALTLPMIGFAIGILALGLGDYIPTPENYDADYVHRYISTQEEARMKTDAYLTQIRMRRGEIENLYRMINRK